VPVREAESVRRKSKGLEVAISLMTKELRRHCVDEEE
jgi:hypothetical protein